MEANSLSDDSNDSDVKSMKNQLIGYGMGEENLTKEEMRDLLKALNNSKSTEKEDEMMRLKANEIDSISEQPSPPKALKRRYLNVRDRRLPWSLLPPNITQVEKAKALSVYIKLMSINKYKQARQVMNFASWPLPIEIVEESNSRIQLRSTRSGRTAPVYAEIDDDSNDIDFVIAKPKKRKISNSDNTDGVYTNKVVSLKRKASKDENNKPHKDIKLIDSNLNNDEPSTSGGSTVKKLSLFDIIED